MCTCFAMLDMWIYTPMCIINILLLLALNLEAGHISNSFVGGGGTACMVDSVYQFRDMA